MKLFAVSLFVFISVSVSYADQYMYRYNPFTGKQDIVTIIAPNITPGSDYTGFTFNGTNFCLYIQGVLQECWTNVSSAVNYALLEDTGFLLLEDDSKMRLEQ